MKVLHILDKYLNLSEVWLYDLLFYLNECENHIACNQIINYDTFCVNTFFFCVNKQGILYELDKSTSFKSNPGKKLFLKARKRLSSSFNKNLLDYIKDNNIDILHAHFGNIGYDSLALSKKANLPLITSFYGYDYDMISHSNKKWASRFRRLFSKGNLFLTEGNFSRSRLIDKGCDPNKILVQKLGVKIGGRTIKVKTERFKIIQIASFTAKKGQLDTIQAFEIAARNNPAIHLTLVGDNRDEKYTEKIKNAIRESEVKDRIMVKEFIPREQIKAILQSHDLFIHPSNHTDEGDSEGGAPTILFYAMLCGLPIISTNHCDIPEVVIHGKTGFLVKERDVEELGAQILNASKMSTKSYLELSKQAYEHLKQNYNIKKNSTQLSEIYHSI